MFFNVLQSVQENTWEVFLSFVLFFYYMIESNLKICEHFMNFISLTEVGHLLGVGGHHHTQIHQVHARYVFFSRLYGSCYFYLE